MLITSSLTLDGISIWYFSAWDILLGQGYDIEDNDDSEDEDLFGRRGIFHEQKYEPRSFGEQSEHFNEVLLSFDGHEASHGSFDKTLGGSQSWSLIQPERKENRQDKSDRAFSFLSTLLLFFQPVFFWLIEAFQDGKYDKAIKYWQGGSFFVNEFGAVFAMCHSHSWCRWSQAHLGILMQKPVDNSCTKIIPIIPIGPILFLKLQVGFSSFAVQTESRFRTWSFVKPDRSLACQPCLYLRGATKCDK